eukprot:7192201-Prymnesium_polylepis.2
MDITAMCARAHGRAVGRGCTLRCAGCCEAHTGARAVKSSVFPWRFADESVLFVVLGADGVSCTDANGFTDAAQEGPGAAVSVTAANGFADPGGAGAADVSATEAKGFADVSLGGGAPGRLNLRILRAASTDCRGVRSSGEQAAC